MKFVIKAKALSDLVGAGASVTPRTTSLDIIRNMMIDVKPDSLSMIATDTLVSIRMVLNGDDIAVKEPGVVLCEADKFQSVCGELRDKNADVEIEGMPKGGLKIKCGRKRFSINAQPVENFPTTSFLSSEEPSMVDLDLAELHEMFSRTAFAASAEKARYAMQGVLLHILPGELRFVATDSKRLAIMKQARDLVKSEVRGVVPNKAVSVLRKALAAEGVVSLNISENEIHFRSDNVAVYTKLVEGQYPPYEAIIPDYEGEGIIVEREALIDVLSAAKIMNDRESMACTFVFEKDKIRLGSRNQGGEAQSELEITNPYDNVVDVDLNSDYVMDALRVMACNSLSIKMKDNDGAIVLSEKDKLTYIIMPMGRKKKAEEKEEKTAEAAS